MRNKVVNLALIVALLISMMILTSCGNKGETTTEDTPAAAEDVNTEYPDVSDYIGTWQSGEDTPILIQNEDGDTEQHNGTIVLFLYDNSEYKQYICKLGEEPKLVQQGVYKLDEYIFNLSQDGTLEDFVITGQINIMADNSLSGDYGCSYTHVSDGFDVDLLQQLTVAVHSIEDYLGQWTNKEADTTFKVEEENYTLIGPDGALQGGSVVLKQDCIELGTDGVKAILTADGDIVIDNIDGVFIYSDEVIEDNIVTIGGKDYETVSGELNLFYENIDDLSDISQYTWLRALVISYTRVGDITPLATLTNLITIKMIDTEVSDISPLAGLSNLQELDMRENPIADYSPLGNLPNLIKLSVDEVDFANVLPYINGSSMVGLGASNCNISDLSFLADNASLEYLMVDSNPIDNDDLVNISHIDTLEKIWIGETNVNDVSVLQSLPNLQYISFYGSKVGAVKGIDKLQSITSLELANSNIYDISFVRELTNLEYIGLSFDNTTDFSVLLELENLRDISIGDLESLTEEQIEALNQLRDKGLYIPSLPET